MKLEKPKNPFARVNPLRSRASNDEFKIIREKAAKYCDGNLSEWIRLAAVMFEPQKKESKK